VHYPVLDDGCGGGGALRRRDSDLHIAFTAATEALRYKLSGMAMAAEGAGVQYLYARIILLGDDNTYSRK
jgi:hypothetical protein